MYKAFFSVGSCDNLRCTHTHTPFILRIGSLSHSFNRVGSIVFSHGAVAEHVDARLLGDAIVGENVSIEGLPALCHVLVVVLAAIEPAIISKLLHVDHPVLEFFLIEQA